MLLADLSRRMRGHHHRRGFTLAELLVALVILAIVLLALARSLIVSLNATADTELQLRANALHNEVLEQFQSVPWEQAGIYVDDPNYVTVFEGEPTVTITEPVGTFSETPPARTTIERDGREFDVVRHVVWAEGSSGSFDLKRMTSIISWSSPSGDARSTRVDAERVITPGEEPAGDDPVITQWDVSPTVNALSLADGTNLGDLDLLVRFDRAVSLVTVEVPVYDVATGSLDPQTVMLTPTNAGWTRFEATVDAGTRVWANGTWSFDVTGLDTTSGLSATGVTSATFLGGPHTCSNCGDQIGSVPQLTVTSPNDGDAFSAGTQIQFTASATDDEDGDITDQIVWETDTDGNIGDGGDFTRPLNTQGPREVTVSVTDSDGNTVTETFDIQINPAENDPPTLTITSPGDGSTATSLPVSFTGTATDPQDGDLSSLIDWTSDIDGPFGSGASIGANLTDGVHTITATVENPDTGLSDTDSIQISVSTAPPVGITSVSVAPNPAGTVTSGPPGNRGRLDQDVTITVVVDGDLDATAGDTVTINYPYWSSVQGSAGNEPPDQAGSQVATQITTGSSSQWQLTWTQGSSSRLFADGQSIELTVTATRASDGDSDTHTSATVSFN